MNESESSLKLRHVRAWTGSHEGSTRARAGAFWKPTPLHASVRALAVRTLLAAGLCYFNFAMAAVKALNPKAEVARAQAALAVNISAARGLQDVLKSNLGPKGTMKM